MHNIKYYLSGIGRIIGRLARGIGRCGSCDGPRNHTALVSPAASSSWSSSSCLGSSYSRSCSRSSSSSSSSSSATAAAVKSGEGVLSLLLLLVLPWPPPPVLPPLVLPGPRPQCLLDPSEALDPSGASCSPPLLLYKALRKPILPRLAFRINNLQSIIVNESAKMNNMYLTNYTK